MRKLVAFESVSLDGFYKDAGGDMSWAHKQDPEWSAFVAGNASGDGALLFGRVTYEMMAGFWPTPAAREMAPAVAEGMNRMTKYVCSRTLESASWQNTTLLAGDAASAVRRLKAEKGPDLAILGSGMLVSSLVQERLIDEIQVVVCPILLGRGTSLFASVEERIPLKLTKTRAFANGNVVLYYEPMK
jgi:dihydrofolate reductase